MFSFLICGKVVFYINDNKLKKTKNLETAAYNHFYNFTSSVKSGEMH